VERNSAGLMHLKNKARIKEGVFVILQIRELIQNVKVEDSLREVGKATWKSFKNVTTNFFGNNKVENCVKWWLVLFITTKL